MYAQTVRTDRVRRSVFTNTITPLQRTANLNGCKNDNFELKYFDIFFLYPFSLNIN